MKSLVPMYSSTLLLLAGAASAGTIHVPRDYPTIQEAVTAAVPGDKIVVSAGLYRENVSVTIDDLSLSGRDAVIDGAFSGSCLVVNADGVTIRGFSFVNGGLAASEGVTGSGGGLDVAGDRASIRGVQTSGSVDFGIRLVGHGTITNCIVAACLGPGLTVDTDDQAGERMSISHNAIYNCGTGIEADDGPFEFRHNTVDNNSGTGIHFTVRAANANGIPAILTEITNNQVRGNHGTGLLVLDEVGVVGRIMKNGIEANGVGLDITGSSVRVESNDISQNRAGGVFLRTNDATFDGNTMWRNTLCGILVSSYSGQGDGRNMLTGNRIEANGGDGIHVTSGANGIVRNRVRGNLGDGMQVETSGTANTLTDNVAVDNHHDGLDNWGTATVLRFNTSKGNYGADLAGIGDGGGTVDPSSDGNMQQDESGLTSLQELELDTLTP